MPSELQPTPHGEIDRFMHIDGPGEPLPLARAQPYSQMPAWARRYLVIVDRAIANKNSSLLKLCALWLGLVFLLIPVACVIALWRGGYRGR